MKALYNLGADGGIFDILAELFYHLVVDVRLQKGLADVVHGVRDICFGDSAPSGQRPENRV